MHSRTFTPSGPAVSDIGLGCWQLGGADWGNIADDDALATLRAAVDAGTTFLDTADVYGAGRSERLVGKFLAETKAPIFVATKLGRSGEPGWPLNFTRKAMRGHVDASLSRLGVDALDLEQLHCVPTEELRRGDVFQFLEEMKAEGKLKRYGASVESDEEALICLEQPGLSSLQIIFNIFRQKPATELFEIAKQRGVAIIARIPLASGLLSGKFGVNTTFDAGDHRNYNRNGDAFNVGETFAGLPFEVGVSLADELEGFVPEGWTMAQMALRWCLDFDAVTVVIPGAKSPEYARANASASDIPPLTDDLHARLRGFYDSRVKDHIRGPY